jgi:hypothetical protein
VVSYILSCHNTLRMVYFPSVFWWILN